jgi:hypothetical protein
MTYSSLYRAGLVRVAEVVILNQKSCASEKLGRRPGDIVVADPFDLIPQVTFTSGRGQNQFNLPKCWPRSGAMELIDHNGLDLARLDISDALAFYLCAVFLDRGIFCWIIFESELFNYRGGSLRVRLDYWSKAFRLGYVGVCLSVIEIDEAIEPVRVAVLANSRFYIEVSGFRNIMNMVLPDRRKAGIVTVGGGASRFGVNMVFCLGRPRVVLLLDFMMLVG